MSYNAIFNIAIVLLLVWFVYARFVGIKGLKNLTPEQFQGELKLNLNRILIDVREPGEVKQGYIAGAKNIPLSQLKQRLGEIPIDKNVYLYCRSGMRSKQAARILHKNGFRNLAHLQGGIMSWDGKITK